MSADAKIWFESPCWWKGIHDGTCIDRDVGHEDMSLSEVVKSIEKCLFPHSYDIRGCRWEFRLYSNPNDTQPLVGLVGWII